MPVLILLLLFLSTAQCAEGDWQWLSLEGQGLWLLKPPQWRAQQQQNQGLLTLEMEAPAAQAGVMLWGGELGMRLNWRQLAELWRRNSAGLEHLRELQPSSGLDASEIIPADIKMHLQEYLGELDGDPSRTWVGYFSQGSRSFVLMGMFPRHDALAEAQVRRVMRSLRPDAPETHAFEPQAPELQIPGPQGEIEAQFETKIKPEPETKPESLSEPEAESGPHQPLLPLESVPQPSDGQAAEAQAEPLAQLRLFQDQALQHPLAGPLPRDIRQLYAQVQIQGLEPGTRLRAEWYYLEGDHGGSPFVVDEKDYPADTKGLTFVLHRPDNTLFPSGNYRLLLIADEQVAAADFFLRDPSEAELLAQAQAGQAEGQFGLYAYLKMGQLRQVTEAEALAWLTQAAHQGLAIAQHHLGLVYFHGQHGQAEDKVMAMDWFRRAALQDHADAAYFMARGYREGLGVPRDLNEAVAWTRRGARLGSAPAQYNLALHHLLGRGLKPDRPKALHWLRKAGSAGYAPAQEALTWLEAEQDNTAP
ncbi:MAG: sel1 repeat family protein [Gammaproteobacteria bacterium SHHR-1]|uniref:sel1 repeat family protein n=1 Tax=Magnetovirga frankeli TaxID=947516 RepID=UPI00129387DE|nr:SEL1-like repeat protein [gamma proteobacterium SS-5]